MILLPTLDTDLCHRIREGIILFPFPVEDSHFGGTSGTLKNLTILRNHIVTFQVARLVIIAQDFKP